jgi:hypothetical protein
MRALSIRQPWAWLIVHGFKPVENRDWSTEYRGPLLIHASKTITQKGYAEIVAGLAEALGDRAPVLPPLAQLQLGGIVGMVDVVDCVTAHDSPYFTGPHGFVLADPQPLPFLPWKGQLGFFDVPTSALDLPHE